MSVFADLISVPEPPNDTTDFDEINESIEYLLERMHDEEWGRIVLTKIDGESFSFENLSIHTPYVFIGDIDYNNKLSPNDAWEAIHKTEKAFDLDLRVYSTHKGLRVINTQYLLDCTTNTGPEMDKRVDLFNSLRCDDKYVKMCEYRHEYAARIVPKTSRPEEQIICKLEKEGAPFGCREILFVVRLHDGFCLKNVDWCDTWRSYND